MGHSHKVIYLVGEHATAYRWATHRVIYLAGEHATTDRCATRIQHQLKVLRQDSLSWPCHIFGVLTYVMWNRRKSNRGKNANPPSISACTIFDSVVLSGVGYHIMIF